jgi:hypothetical protein
LDVLNPQLNAGCTAGIMSTVGQQLFFQITAGLWSTLERYRAQAAAKLEGLGPEPNFPDSRLLTALRADDITAGGDPGVEALINDLQQVLPNLSPGAPVALHGFAPGNGQPRGLAVAVTIPPSITFVRKGLSILAPGWLLMIVI